MRNFQRAGLAMSRADGSATVSAVILEARYLEAAVNRAIIFASRGPFWSDPAMYEPSEPRITTAARHRSGGEIRPASVGRGSLGFEWDACRSRFAGPGGDRLGGIACQASIIRSASGQRS